MTNRLKIITSLILGSCIWINDTSALNKFGIAEYLTLTLSVDNRALPASNNEVPLLVTLTNKTDKSLQFTVSTNPEPPLVYMWNKQGQNLTRKHQPPLVKNGSNPGRKITIKPNEVIVFDRQVDLLRYKEDLKGDTTVIFKSSFVFFKMTKDTMHYGPLKSNELTYKLP